MILLGFLLEVIDRYSQTRENQRQHGQEQREANDQSCVVILGNVTRLELNDPSVFAITEKAFSWLKAPTSTLKRY